MSAPAGMRQLRLIPSGVQSWFRDTIAASAEFFAYASTMALYIYRLRDNGLHKMIVAHHRAIASICFCPTDENLLASCAEGKLAVWDIDAEEEKFKCKVAEAPQLLDWAPHGDKIAIVLDSGDVKLWEYSEGEKLTKLFKIAANNAKVLRWHPRDAVRLLLGTADGSLIIYDQRTGKQATIVGRAKTSKDPVTDAQWDPLSEDYMLVAFGDGSLVLYDASSQKEIHSFDKQHQPIRTLAWARSQPGNFVTGTDKVGVLRLWNVSQKAPLAMIKVGSSGVSCIKAVPSEPNYFVISFKNSSVGVVDIATKQMRFMSAPGHSETIFDVAYHPSDPEVLATASYDGHVKIWRVSSMEAQRDMFSGKDQLLYGLAWGPGATKICAVSSTGYLFIWRADTGECLLRQQLHNGQAYRVEWNHRGRTDGAGEIVTGGNDGIACVVDAVSGNVLKRISHTSAVVGVAWHPGIDGCLATACQDHVVRLYTNFEAARAEAGEWKPVVSLAGHDQRVFNIAFHPVCPDLIASGSDDKTVRVWKWAAGAPGRQCRRLVGHTNYVRGLLWHSELAHILFSGSWDATIRVWNVATGTCLHTCFEHHADVYGLTLHPERPFFLVSSSRDTTVRFWVFEDLVRPLLVQALVWPHRLEELLGGSPEEVTHYVCSEGGVEDMPVKLYGQASKKMVNSVQQILNLTGGQPTLKVYQAIVSFFTYRQGLEDFWGLLTTLRKEPPICASSSRTTFHEQELIACQKSKALELASQRMTIGLSMKLEDRLLKAAQIMLRVGDLRSYCKFMAQAGQWERAICIAPAVSKAFWSELCNEYLETLTASPDPSEAAAFWIATGKAPMLIDNYIERGDMDSAFVVAKADCDGVLPMPVEAESNHAPAPPAPPPPDGSEARSRLEDVAASLAARYADQAEPLQAAMCFLAVSATQRAVMCLSRAHEVVLAYVCAALLSLPQDPLVLKLLAQCLERDHRWQCAADLLMTHPEGPTVQLPLLASRIPDKALAHGLCPPPPETYEARMQEALNAGDRRSAVLWAVCADQRSQAAELGVQYLIEIFSRGYLQWHVSEARAILDPIEALPLQDMSVKDIAGILSCAAFVGLVEASQEGYSELMFPLAQTYRNIVSHQGLSLGIGFAEVSLLEAVGRSRKDPQGASESLASLLTAPDTPDHLRHHCQAHLDEIHSRPPAALPAADGPGLAPFAGGRLPACYKRHAKLSVLTNQPIRGPEYPLEDNTRFISLGEALAWCRVNAFSPLNTGCKINPY
eukprot:TRINITY_DN40719_c0_g1_i1.p1 TRINITY_DN40719_c0_g1~~TRINITY_DN40719_c0_g1_i1.p1  ORF type:complete len:1260 (-),score=209.45 TRINITY_DN40719_c0_g1_i1:239-4018(-)